MLDKTQINPTNLTLHFLTMVLGIVSSLAIMIGVVLDARYAQSDELDAAIQVTAKEIAEVSSEVREEVTARKIIEAQVRRDILNAKEDSIELKEDISVIRRSVSQTNENVAILLERTK